MAIRGNYNETVYDSLTSKSRGRFLATLKFIAHGDARD